MVYFWVLIMAYEPLLSDCMNALADSCFFSYLMFASIFITVRSVQAQIEEGGFTVSDLFTNTLFFTIIVSLLSTYVLYLVASIMFLDPWHMFTSVSFTVINPFSVDTYTQTQFIQYLLLTPTYINILNVYAFCNTHDITWGTKGDDKPEKLSTVTTKPGGKVDVNIPTDDGDLNAQYEAELRAFASKYQPPKKNPSASEKQEDYYKGFRSGVVLAWMFCNMALVAVVLNAGGMDRLTVDNEIEDRANIYMQVVLWSVAGLSAFRFVGAVWFLIVRMVRARQNEHLARHMLIICAVPRSLTSSPQSCIVLDLCLALMGSYWREAIPTGWS